MRPILRRSFVAAALLALVAAWLVPFSPETTRSFPVPAASESGEAPDLGQAPPAPTLAGRGDVAQASPSSEGRDAEEGVADDTMHSDVLADASPDAEEEEDTSHLQGGLPLTIDHPLVSPVAKVQTRRTHELLQHPLVVGTAIGMNERGEIALVVLAKAPIVDLPSSIDDVPVLVHVSGELWASKGKPGSGGAAVDPKARFDRPVPIGVSTGHPDITAGTIGCRLLGNSGTLFALSNNHVYADENLATQGDAVIQPGTYDGGASPDDDVGTLDQFVALDFRSLLAGGSNTMDAALALSDGATLGHSTPSNGYGRPRTATEAPAINLRVQKYGRTTSLTSGKIFAINASVNVGYATGTAGFIGQIVITPGSFSAGGDSGSLIVGKSGASARKPVALLFAGSASSTIASPIDAILSHFGVAVDGN
jgi:hypothetical protein